jgi:hypothetical protein
MLTGSAWSRHCGVNAAHQQRARGQCINQSLMAARLLDELVSVLTLNQAGQSIFYYCTGRMASLLVGVLGFTSGVGAINP